MKLLTHKQTLQRLQIALEQVKAGSTSENVLNETHQITYSLFQEQEITKKENRKIMSSIKLI